MRSLIAGWAVLVALVGVGSTHGESVVINEFMADNENTLIDDFGNYSDWIELYNPGAASVNLDGWFLTDDQLNLTKWALPALAIDSQRYLLVFASGRDLRDPLKQLHTNFKLSSSGEYLGLVLPDGMTAVHEYVPAYPPQKPNVAFSYGLWQGKPEVFLAPTPRGPNVPEPSVLALLGMGAFGLGLGAWRRKRN